MDLFLLISSILFNFTAIYYCNKFITIPNELYCYFQSPESITRGKYNIKYLDTFFDILGYIEAFLQEVERKDMALNDAMKMRIYSYFFITYFAETFSDSFLQDESAKKILEEKLQQYFPQGHRYILFFIYHLKETRSMLNQYYQRVRILETETPILVQANRRRELASMLVRMNQEDWETFVESNIYTAYWEFLYKISWKETTLGQDQRVYHELQQYLSEKRELWQLHCIYFASLLYEKPWNVPFLPQLRQLPNLLVQQYLQYVGHIAADQADCRQSQYIEFNAKLSEMILLALVTK